MNLLKIEKKASMKGMSRIEGKTLSQKPTLNEKEDFDQRMRCLRRRL